MIIYSLGQFIGMGLAATVIWCLPTVTLQFAMKRLGQPIKVPYPVLFGSLFIGFTVLAWAWPLAIGFAAMAGILLFFASFAFYLFTLVKGAPNRE